MENLEKLERIIGKFPAQNWSFYAKKLGWSRSKFYEYAFTLQLQNKVYSKNGLWYLKNAEIEKPSKLNAKVEAALAYWSWRAKQHGNRFYKHLVEYEKAENKR